MNDKINDINTLLVPRAPLAAPAQAAALVTPSDDGFMAAVNEMDGLYAAPAQAVPASVIMASVMRDDGGEHPAFCLMVAYRAEKDAMTALAMLTDEPAQAAAPDMTDAYAGAREDLSIWKKRALEAEALNRKFAASVNSPSFMGEPAAPAQAAPVDAAAQEDAERWQFLAEYLVGTRTDLDDEIVGCDSVQKMARVLDAARAAQKGGV